MRCASRARGWAFSISACRASPTSTWIGLCAPRRAAALRTGLLSIGPLPKWFTTRTATVNYVDNVMAKSGMGNECADPGTAVAHAPTRRFATLACQVTAVRHGREQVGKRTNSTTPVGRGSLPFRGVGGLGPRQCGSEPLLRQNTRARPRAVLIALYYQMIAFYYQLWGSHRLACARPARTAASRQRPQRLEGYGRL
jgi:hypothetical protein